MKKKARLEYFEFYDASGIERHLEKMAEKGWLLCEISGLWIYQRIEPKKLKFAVTYFCEASDYTPYPSNEQEVFLAYCENAGWQLIAENSKMQIFCSTVENPIPIETDEEIKLNLIHAAMKKILWMWCSIPVFIILNFFTILSKIMRNPLQNLSDYNNFILILINVWTLVTSIAEIIRYIEWRERSKKAVALGGECCAVKKSNLLLNSLIPFLFFLLIAIVTQSMLLFVVLVLCIAIVLVSIILSAMINRFLKRHGATYWENVSVSTLSILVILLITFNLMASSIERSIESRQAEGAEVVSITDEYGSTKEWRFVHDELPLTLEDMNAETDTRYSYEKQAQETFLLSYVQGSQSSVTAGRMKEMLTYEIVEPKTEIIYDLCLNDLMKLHLDNNTHWKVSDAQFWQADTAYRLYHNEQPFQNEYLICWKNRIVRIKFMWDVTSEQLEAAANILRII